MTMTMRMMKRYDVWCDYVVWKMVTVKNLALMTKITMLWMVYLKSTKQYNIHLR